MNSHETQGGQSDQGITRRKILIAGGAGLVGVHSAGAALQLKTAGVANTM